MKRKIILSLIGILFILIVGSYSIFFFSLRPIVQAQDEATVIAEEAAGIEEVDDFFWYNGLHETYFTIGGYTAERDYLYVMVKQDGGDVTILNAAYVVTEDEAKSILLALKAPEEILEAKLGQSDSVDSPFWEVSYKDENGLLHYAYISVTTGELIKEIKNI